MEKGCRKKNVIASFLGSISEWYEFVVYAFCAPIIAPLFFPADNKAVSILGVFGAFFVGFLMRPLGALVFGHYGDKYGRQKTVSMSVILIGLPTFFMGIMPTYQEIGLLAPVLLIIVRMLQGLSVGGQFTGSSVFINEHIGPEKQFLGAGLTFSGAFIGMLFASAIGSFLTYLLTDEQLKSFGWRIPFILGVFVTLLGYYLKTSTDETPEYKKLKNNNQLSKNPIKDSFKTQKISMALAIFICWLTPLIVYQLFIFMPTYASEYLNLDLAYALKLNSLSLVFLSVGSIFWGYVADKVGYYKVMFSSAILLALLSPYFYWLMAINASLYPFIQVIFAIMGAAFVGPVMGVLNQLFNSKVRYTSLSISYNVGFGLFGGSASLLCILLINKTEINWMPGFYISLSAVISLIALSIAQSKIIKASI